MRGASIIAIAHSLTHCTTGDTRRRSMSKPLHSDIGSNQLHESVQSQMDLQAARRLMEQAAVQSCAAMAALDSAEAELELCAAQRSIEQADKYCRAAEVVAVSRRGAYLARHLPQDERRLGGAKLS
ncbi:hypothetical protein T492DRAFT_839071 [Pavlovales sp. CCMP2436]|nr:hypothetical protein T492DRAFT_839071 [Pavlovales sp. CCMP2436]|mmetsp:Transcript_34966/g.87219  ORF Transcript_34966/g.87219 Transcript_34966/m.87219 type:complete len:126 (-) Transcript_34966:378-755(-)